MDKFGMKMETNNDGVVFCMYDSDQSSIIYSPAVEMRSKCKEKCLYKITGTGIQKPELIQKYLEQDLDFLEAHKGDMNKDCFDLTILNVSELLESVKERLSVSQTVGEH
jgi:hypothetical protein